MGGFSFGRHVQGGESIGLEVLSFVNSRIRVPQTYTCRLFSSAGPVSEVSGFRSVAAMQSFQDLRAGSVERSRFAVKTFQIAHFQWMGSASQVPGRSRQNKDKSTKGWRSLSLVDAGGTRS